MYLVGVEENNGVLRSLCSLAAGCQSQAWAPCLSYSLICLMITVSDDVQIDYLWLENNGEIMKNILNTLKGPSIFFVSYKFTLWHQAGQESLRTQCLPSHPPSLQIDSLLMARVFIIPPKLICETQIRVSNERDLLLTELIVPITSYYSHKTKQKLDITHHTSHITHHTLHWPACVGSGSLWQGQHFPVQKLHRSTSSTISTLGLNTLYILAVKEHVTCGDPLYQNTKTIFVSITE